MSVTELCRITFIWLPTQPLPHLVGDDLGAGGASAVAGHDGAALDTEGVALSIHHALQHGEALGAETLDGGLHL